jgi:hypothetical protein
MFLFSESLKIHAPSYISVFRSISVSGNWGLGSVNTEPCSPFVICYGENNKKCNRHVSKSHAVANSAYSIGDGLNRILLSNASVAAVMQPSFTTGGALIDPIK